MKVITKDNSLLLCFTLLPYSTRQLFYSFSYFFWYLFVLQKNDLLILLS